MSGETLDHVVRNFSAVETGKEIRRALRDAFPGVKFSLRMSRGTGYGWFSLSWTDGPTHYAADAICNGFRSTYFDGMTDSTYSIPSTLYALEDGTLYEPRWSCHGVNTSREFSPEAEAWARTYVDAHGGPETFEQYPGNGYSRAVWRILQGVDLVGVDWSTVPAVTPEHSGRRVASCYLVETSVNHWSDYAPTHRAEVAQ